MTIATLEAIHELIQRDVESKKKDAEDMQTCWKEALANDADNREELRDLNKMMWKIWAEADEVRREFESYDFR